MITEQEIRDALKVVKYPGFSRDIVSFGIVKSISIDDTRAHILLHLETKDQSVPEQIYQNVREVLEKLPGSEKIQVELEVVEPVRKSLQNEGGPVRQKIPHVAHIVAIASGKGGVGKSTISANLAVALAQQGLRVGLLDCDLYGPSMPLMFGIHEKPYADENNKILPKLAHGVQVMSMGLLLDGDSPVVVRGPLATRYIQQFLHEVAWDDLDVLLLDLPPGTGDIQLTLVQTIELDGAIIVTTPQEVALIDARKAISMFGKVSVDILGIIENMSWFECPSDGKRYAIFGENGGKLEADRLGVDLLGQIPLEMSTREGGDKGNPVVLSQPNSTSAQTFALIANKLVSNFKR